jgi:hypothetical protein
VECVVYLPAVKCKKGVLKDVGKLGWQEMGQGPHISSEPLVPARVRPWQAHYHPHHGLKNEVCLMITS